jgi:hypothetical protein
MEEKMASAGAVEFVPCVGKSVLPGGVSQGDAYREWNVHAFENKMFGMYIQNAGAGFGRCRSLRESVQMPRDHP